VRPLEAASPAELMLSLADQLRDPDGKHDPQIATLRNWLRDHPAHAHPWRRILRGQRIEASRLSGAQHDAYSGHLSHPSLRAAAARRLDPRRSFSASRLKDYGLCGFRYFAKRLLKLDETIEPEEGFDQLQLGALNHHILEETYATIGSLGISIREENLERALAIFERVAKAILDHAPQALGFRASATWAAEKEVLLRRLRALIVIDFSADSPLNDFGGDRRVLAVEHYFSDREVALPGQEQPLRLHGFIDRIDVVDGRLILVDYKTGSTKINRDEMESGRDFQMMTYALAMLDEAKSSDAQGELAGGMFWHIRNLQASGKFDVADEDDIAALNAALAHVSENLRRGRLGQFPVHPTATEAGKCSRYCEYSHLCRMSLTHRYKLPSR
jgi:ATP-dependent helicase/DNAse subunit B